MFFLRKLFLKKNLVLFGKNLKPIFYFFSRLINFFNFYKNLIFKKNLIFYKNTYLLLFPKFFFKKQIFKDNLLFFDLIKKNNLDYFLNSKYFLNNYKLNFIIFSKSKLSVLNFFNNMFVAEKNDNNNKKNEFLPFDLKKIFLSENTYLDNSFNFFYNYNLYLLNLLEIYKIIILLYLNKINKKYI